MRQREQNPVPPLTAAPLIQQADPGRSKSPAKVHKSTRTDFSDYQLSSLIAILGEDKNPSVERREEIARFLGMKHDQVKIWYKNRRARSGKNTPGENLSKRIRTKYSNRQREILLNIFQDYPKPNDGHLEEISKDVQIKVESLKIWFKNRRADVRKKGLGISSREGAYGKSH